MTTKFSGYIKFIWDSANDSTWAGEFIPEKNPVGWNESNSGFQMVLSGSDGKYDYYNIGIDNLPTKRDWRLSFECSQTDRNNFKTLWDFIRNTAKTNRYFRFYPDIINSPSTYYNCLFIGEWIQQYSNRVWGTSLERYVLNFNIMEK